MGGIPTDNDAHVLADETGTMVEGLYAAGEVACVSVHGANRLGTNSLVDLVVFGKRGGMKMAEYCKAGQLPRDQQEHRAHRRRERSLNTLRNSNGNERPAPIRKEYADDDGRQGRRVSHRQRVWEQALDTIKELQARFKHIEVEDKGLKWNTDLMEAWELGCLLDLAEVTAFRRCGPQRKPRRPLPRGLPNRDDANFLKHTMAGRTATVDVKYKPVRITRIQPQERKY